MMKNKLQEKVYLDKDSSVIESNIGRYSTIGKNSQVYYANIGNFVSISWDVTIGAIQHPTKTLTTHSFPYSSAFEISNNNQLSKTPTNIGHDVWIGAGAIIMPNINIGNGAIIGAGSIVTKDVKAYHVVAGNPATLLYKRFDEDLIMEIENLKWWFWEKELIQKTLIHFKEELTIESIQKLKNIYKGVQ